MTKLDFRTRRRMQVIRERLEAKVADAMVFRMKKLARAVQAAFRSPPVLERGIDQRLLQLIEGKR